MITNSVVKVCRTMSSMALPVCARRRTGVNGAVR
jgi:hypothetical protein